MSTLTDIRRAADSPVHTCVDSTTPDGHFIATAKVVGLVTSYLCAGQLDDPAAPIVGRIEWGAVDAPLPVFQVYAGDRIKGGDRLADVYDDEDAFRRMIARSAR